MIIDLMTKYEVIVALRKDFENEVLPYYHKNRPKYQILIESKAKRTKTTINLGWIGYCSHNLIKYQILVTGDAYGDKPYYTAQFIWHGKTCYASFFRNKYVIVFQKHCLERYAERVLKKSIDPKEVFIKYLLKKQDSAFNIVLPTPTHEISNYFGLANALFLGDFLLESCCNETKGIWCNTCISLREAHYTQSKIMSTLSFMQSFVNRIGYNPIDSFGLSNKDAKLAKTDIKFRKELSDFYIKSYLLLKLHFSFGLEVTKYEDNKSLNTMQYIENILSKIDISVSDLSPYDTEYGVALQGEINYIG